MRQQINLYRFLPIERQWRFTKEMLIIFYSVFFFLLMANYFYELWGRHNLVKQFEQSSAALIKAQAHIAAITKQYTFIDLTDLTGSLKKLQDDLVNQQKIESALETKLKFSAYLGALSQAVVPGIWLSEISFSASERTVTLKGHALQASSTQVFLNKLSEQPVFKDFRFKLEDLTEVLSDKQTTIDFVVTGKAVKPL